MEGDNEDEVFPSIPYILNDSTSTCSSDEDASDIYVPTFVIPPANVTFGDTSKSMKSSSPDVSKTQDDLQETDYNPTQTELLIQGSNDVKEKIKDEFSEGSSNLSRIVNLETSMGMSKSFNQDIETDGGFSNNINQDIKSMIPTSASVSQGNTSKKGDVDIDQISTHKEEDKHLKNTLLHDGGGNIVIQREQEDHEDIIDKKLECDVSANPARASDNVFEGKPILNNTNRILLQETNRAKEGTELLRKTSMEEETSKAKTHGSQIETLYEREMPHDSTLDRNNYATNSGNLYPTPHTTNSSFGPPPQPLAQQFFPGNQNIGPWNQLPYGYPGYNMGPPGAYHQAPFSYPKPSMPHPWMYGPYQQMPVDTTNQVQCSEEVIRDNSTTNAPPTPKPDPLSGRNHLENLPYEDVNKADQNKHNQEAVAEGALQTIEGSTKDETSWQTSGSKIVITFTGDISKDTLLYYFENTKKSGGGDIETIDNSSDTGLAVIEFKTQEAAKNVLRKNSVHRISNIDLTVHVIESDNDLSNVIEERMVFVKGIKLSTSEDCLRDCMEVRADSEPTQITYGTDRSCAIIMFDDKIDIRRLEEACNKKLLEGNRLSVFRVPVTSSVLVSGIVPEVSSDGVRYYFENKRKSGGDDEAELVEYNGTTCVIRFPSPEVARRVCDKEHLVGKFRLNVSLYYECLGNLLQVAKIPEPEFFSADAYFLKFIKSSPKVKEEFEHELKKLNGCVIWPEDVENNDIRIECDLDLSTSEGQREATLWQSKISDFTEKFKSSFTSMKMTTVEGCWKAVKMELKSMNISDPDRVGVFLEKDNYAIVIVGDRKVVKDLCHNVQTVISESERKVLATANSSSKVISFKIFKLQLLWLLKYFDKVMTNFPDVKAECNLERKEVTLTGPVESMQGAELFLREAASSFECSNFKLSKYKKELLFKKVSRDIWYNECKTKQITATWNVDREHVTCQMYALTKKDAERAIICMEDLFLEDEFSVDDQYEQFIKSSEWRELLNKLERRDEKCFHIHTDNSGIQMAAIKYIFHEIKSDIEREIDKFSKLYGKETARVNCDKGVHMFLRHLGQKSLHAIETLLAKMDVKIKGSDKDFSFQVSGNKTGVSIATSKIEKLMSGIHSDKYKLESFGMRDYFLTTQGKKDSIEIGKKNACIVLHESEYSEEKARRGRKGTKLSSPELKKKEFMHDDDHKIFLMQTDITKLEVDAIVNAANNDLDHCGGLAKAIVDAAGRSVQEECEDYIKHKGPVEDGDAMCSKPGKLPCKTIIHAVGPMWKGGYQGEKALLKAAVLQCLSLTGLNQYCSVAIPALSGGIFGYPLDKCTVTIVQTIKEFFDKYGSSTTVSEVYLCDVTLETVKKFDLALKCVYRGDSVASRELSPLRYPGSDPKPSKEVYLSYPRHTESSPSRHDPSPTDDRRNHHRNSPNAVGPESEGQGLFRVVKGLLTDRKVDVIVNCINQDLDLSHGRLSKSILQAAGDIIQTELYQNIGTFKPYQNIAVTSGGKLSSRYIFHGVLLKFDGTNGKGVQILEELVDLCMMKGYELKLSTIAFPAVGTGVLSFPADLVAKIMVERIQQFQERFPQSSIKSVEFVIYPKDTAAINAFEDRLKKVSRKSNDSALLDSKDRVSTSAAPTDHKPSNRRNYGRVKVPTSTDHKPRPTGRVQPTKLGDVNVLIKCGDITKESVDAIVNSTSYSLDLSKGAVSKAILAAAGPDIQRELRQEGEGAKGKGLIVTSGGKLDCKHVFHIIAQSSSVGWEDVVTKCLTEAEKRKLATLSLPALGTGLKSCGPAEVATAIFQAIKKFSSIHHLKHVTLVVFQKEMAADFITALKKTAGIHRDQGKSRTPGIHKDQGKAQGSARPKGQSRDTVSFKEESKEDTVNFYLWSDSWTHISAAKRDLKQLAESQCCQKSVNDYPKVVSQLKSDEIFREAERKFKVKINDQKGSVSIEGSPADVNNASDHIRTQLRQKENQMMDYERAKDVANYVQWYYQTQHDKKFRPFKLEDNHKIEAEYKNKNMFVKITDSKGVSYKIDFQSMVEVASDKPNVKIPVKRENKEKSSGAGQLGLPSNWSKIQMKPKQLCHEEQVFSGSTEYDRVKNEFKKSGGTGNIVKIYRVQNPTLYLQYAAKKKELWNKNNKNPEKWLWHGTSADTVDQIINHGFNRSYCGKNGTAYGAGVYFAVQASYSVGYCQPGSKGVSHIFSVQVLTGETCHGNSGMKVLPSKPGNSLMTYDSSSDNPGSPVMFVIFHDCQAYPTYHVVFQSQMAGF